MPNLDSVSKFVRAAWEAETRRGTTTKPWSEYAVEDGPLLERVYERNTPEQLARLVGQAPAARAAAAVPVRIGGTRVSHVATANERLAAAVVANLDKLEATLGIERNDEDASPEERLERIREIGESGQFSPEELAAAEAVLPRDAVEDVARLGEIEGRTRRAVLRADDNKTLRAIVGRFGSDPSRAEAVAATVGRAAQRLSLDRPDDDGAFQTELLAVAAAHDQTGRALDDIAKLPGAEQVAVVDRMIANDREAARDHRVEGMSKSELGAELARLTGADTPSAEEQRHSASDLMFVPAFSTGHSLAEGMAQMEKDIAKSKPAAEPPAKDYSEFFPLIDRGAR